MNRTSRIGRYAVGVILWLVASPSLGSGYGGALSEPRNRVRTQANQQMTEPDHLLGSRGALRDLPDGCRALPAMDGSPGGTCTAADPGERGGAEGRDLAGFQARVCANFGAGAPGRMYQCEEGSTPGGGHRSHTDLPDYACQQGGGDGAYADQPRRRERK